MPTGAARILGWLHHGGRRRCAASVPLLCRCDPFPLSLATAADVFSQRSHRNSSSTVQLPSAAATQVAVRRSYRHWRPTSPLQSLRSATVLSVTATTAVAAASAAAAFAAVAVAAAPVAAAVVAAAFFGLFSVCLINEAMLFLCCGWYVRVSCAPSCGALLLARHGRGMFLVCGRAGLAAIRVSCRSLLPISCWD